MNQTEYLPFGETWFQEGNSANKAKFNSQELDEESGFYFYNARHYDPEIGRFVTADNVVAHPFNTQSWNRYSYVLNNPVRYSDPTGNEEEGFDVTSEITSSSSNEVDGYGNTQQDLYTGTATCDGNSNGNGNGNGNSNGTPTSASGTADLVDTSDTCFGCNDSNRFGGIANSSNGDGFVQINVKGKIQTGNTRNNNSNPQSSYDLSGINLDFGFDYAAASRAEYAKGNNLRGFWYQANSAVEATYDIGLAYLGAQAAYLVGSAAARYAATRWPWLAGAGNQLGKGRVWNNLNVLETRAPTLRTVAERIEFRGNPSSIIRGTDVARKGGGIRAFITDAAGKIIKEITPQRVKIRITNISPDGSVYETFKKIGEPSQEDLKILDLFK